MFRTINTFKITASSLAAPEQVFCVSNHGKILYRYSAISNSIESLDLRSEQQLNNFPISGVPWRYRLIGASSYDWVAYVAPSCVKLCSATLKQEHTLVFKSKFIAERAAFHPCHPVVCIYGPYEASVWEIGTWKELCTFRIDEAEKRVAVGMSFKPNSMSFIDDMLVITDDEGRRKPVHFDWRTGTFRGKLDIAHAYLVTSSPFARMFACVSRKHISIYDKNFELINRHNLSNEKSEGWEDDVIDLTFSSADTVIFSRYRSPSELIGVRILEKSKRPSRPIAILPGEITQICVLDEDRRALIQLKECCPVKLSLADGALTPHGSGHSGRPAIFNISNEEYITKSLVDHSSCLWSSTGFLLKGEVFISEQREWSIAAPDAFSSIPGIRIENKRREIAYKIDANVEMTTIYPDNAEDKRQYVPNCEMSLCGYYLWGKVGIENTFYLVVWRLETGEEVCRCRIFDGRRLQPRVHMSRDGKYLAYSNDAIHSIVVHDTSTGEEIAVLKHFGEYIGQDSSAIVPGIGNYALSENGRLLVSRDGKGIVRCWDVLEQKVLFSKSAYFNYLQCERGIEFLSYGEGVLTHFGVEALLSEDIPQPNAASQAAFDKPSLAANPTSVNSYITEKEREKKRKSLRKSAKDLASIAKIMNRKTVELSDWHWLIRMFWSEDKRDLIDAVLSKLSPPDLVEHLLLAAYSEGVHAESYLRYALTHSVVIAHLDPTFWQQIEARAANATMREIVQQARG